MDDPKIPGRFPLSDHNAVTDPRWWNEATSIWISADRAALRDTAPRVRRSTMSGERHPTKVAVGATATS